MSDGDRSAIENGNRDPFFLSVPRGQRRRRRSLHPRRSGSSRHSGVSACEAALLPKRTRLSRIRAKTVGVRGLRKTLISGDVENAGCLAIDLGGKVRSPKGEPGASSLSQSLPGLKAAAVLMRGILSEITSAIANESKMQIIAERFSSFSFSGREIAEKNSHYSAA